MVRCNDLRLILAIGLSGSLLTGCDSGTSAPNSVSLTIMGAAYGPCGLPTGPQATLCASPSVAASNLNRDSVTSGDPASLTIGVYALWISHNADCSSPILVDDYGATPSDKDFVANPVLFTGSPEDGAYQCVMIKMSDVLRMKPATSFGNCIAGTEYSGDIYREGENDWIDVNGDPIVGTGTDEAPVDSKVTIFITRDTTAAIARGVSGNQVVELASDLVVPSSTTFYWNGQGTVVDEGGQCGINPGRPSFQ